MLLLSIIRVPLLITIIGGVVFTDGAYIPVYGHAINTASTPLNDLRNANALQKRDISGEERQYLNLLEASFQGIFFTYAYPGASTPEEDGGCTKEKFNILVEATRNAIRLAEYTGSDLLREDSSTHMMFMRNSLAPIGGRWTSHGNTEAYAQLHHNLIIPSRFPVEGKGSKSRRVRVAYQCKDVVTPGGTTCGPGVVPAYTVGPPFSPDGWTTVFCDKFFQAGTYLNRITAGPKKNPADFGDPRLISYEQMILHEWMHADVMGYAQHIDDLSDSLGTDPRDPVVPVYGKSRCQDFAWKFMKEHCDPRVNIATRLNADNYAWYFAHKYYSKIWGWQDSGAPLSLIHLLGNLIEECPKHIPEIPKPEWPRDCWPVPKVDAVNVTITCSLETQPQATVSATAGTSPSPTFVGSPLPGKFDGNPCNCDGNPCNCNESRCSDDSPPCCMNGSCESR